MPIYKAPVEDVMFLLKDVFPIERHNNLPGFADATPETVEAILGEGASCARRCSRRSISSGDQEGCTRIPDGSVTTPRVQGGLRGLCGGRLDGACPCRRTSAGRACPRPSTRSCRNSVSSANLALGMYPGLTQGAIAALFVHGSEEQKKTYLPKMVEGAWTGTMNLTEPHCGTDLGLLKTKAVPNGDGSYAISGTKIFISAGEHDMAENIVHLVLARIEGAPQGTKGISLFVVPKFLVNATVRSAERNGVSCGSLEHKMGIHGNATCVMNYDGAKGWLDRRGKPRPQRHVRDDERGAPRRWACRVSRNPKSPTRTRSPMRRTACRAGALTGAKFPDKPADPIIVHPDVRRTLLSIRAFNEAGRALLIWTALKATSPTAPPTRRERQVAEDHMGLMTPIAKGVLTDLGFDNTVKAQQMFGGHGYIEESGMSQFVRDARIAHDLRGRQRHPGHGPRRPQARQGGGRAVMAFFNEVGAFCQENAGDETHEGLHRAAAAGPRPICSRRPCGSCRTPWRSPTTPAPAPPITCTSSASSPWATCGRRWQRPLRQEG